MFKIAIVASVLCLLTAACASDKAATPADAGFQTLGAAGASLAVIGAPPAPTEYRLGPLDKIGISVYQQPDFSFPELQVDAGGQIVMPQVGPMIVADKTTNEVAQAIAVKLAQCCFVNPQVNVTLREALSQQVTVVGAVKNTGIYSLRGHTTLQQVVAMAGGADPSTANLKSVGIIRTQNGQRMGAKFNLEEISNGKADDPPVQAGDTIIVDTSGSKSMYKAVLSAIPLAAFVPLLGL